MKMNFKKKISSFFLCMMLIMAMAFVTTGCSDDTKTNGDQETPVGQGSESTDSNILGEGKTTFHFVVVDGEGNETTFEIHTDKTTVGEALLELELIEGDMGDFGLYVKTVNGITADYDKDGTYWAFYINDEYAMTGVDATDITEGDTYSFKVEK